MQLSLGELLDRGLVGLEGVGPLAEGLLALADLDERPLPVVR